MREGKNRNNHDIPEDWNPEQDLGDLKDVVKAYRNSVCEAAERPEHYWRRKQGEILQSLNRPGPVNRVRTVLAWAPAALMAILCLLFFAQNSPAPPKPDLAGGSDEILLINVERALGRDCPDALAPVGLITGEGAGSAGVLPAQPSKGNR